MKRTSKLSIKQTEYFWMRGMGLALAILWTVSLTACSGGGGDADSPSNRAQTLYVGIDGPDSALVTSASADITGTASCDLCPPSKTELGFCPAIQPPHFSAMDVKWHNKTAGTEGSVAFNLIAGQCSCFFSYCTTSYGHFWKASVPLNIGANTVEIVVSDASGGHGSDSITLTRHPSVITGLVASPGKGQVTLSWDPVEGATSYNVYWATNRDVSATNGTKIAGVANPFVHTGLTDDVVHYYVVTVGYNGIEEQASNVAHATPGWHTETVAVTTSTTYARTAAIDTDSLGNAHLNYAFEELLTSNVNAIQNFYATNATGRWASVPIPQSTRTLTSNIVISSTDIAHIAYLDSVGLQHTVYYVGATPGFIELVSLGRFIQCDVALALDRNDTMHIASIINTGSYSQIEYRTVNEDPRVTGPVQPTGCPHGLSLGVDANGSPHVAIAGYGALQYATIVNGAWVMSQLDLAGMGARDEVALAIDLNGKIHIAYTVSTSAGSSELKYAHNVSGAWVVEVVNIDSPRHAALALDASGTVHLSFVAGSATGELRYATNSTGSWRFVTVDNARVDNLSAHASDTGVAVDRDGKVHISYVRGADIRYATNK